MRGTWSLLLAGVVWGSTLGAGCGGARTTPAPDPNEQYRIPAKVDAADLEGPVADVSGRWVTEDLTLMVSLQQQGSKVVGKVVAIPSAGQEVTEVVQGEVNGRVFQATVPSKYGFTLGKDGQSGTVHVGAGAFKAFRFYVGSASRDNRVSNDPYLSGGVIYRYPFGAKGPLDHAVPEKPTLREVVVLMKPQDMGSDTWTFFHLIPLAAQERPAMLVRMGERKGTVLSFFDLEEFCRARQSSPVSQKRKTILEGRPGWWVLLPQWNPQQADREPVLLSAHFYRDDPETGAPPAEIVEAVAVRTPDKGWQSSGSVNYLMTTSQLHRASVVIENGMPAGMDVAPVPEPGLRELLMMPGTSAARMRWRNRLLADSKARALPKLLSETKTADLPRLIETLESQIVTANRAAEMSTFEGSPAGETPQMKEMRERNAATKEWIGVVKPILAAMKEEAANRDK